MTANIINHTGKLLFPALARDQRNRRMRIILLVMTACLFSTGGLTVWMMLTSISTGHIITIPGTSFH